MSLTWSENRSEKDSNKALNVFRKRNRTRNFNQISMLCIISDHANNRGIGGGNI